MNSDADIPPTKRLALGIGLLSALVLLAGCGGILGGASVSGIEAQTIDGRPAVSFNYSVGDYSDVLLENPDGDIVNRGTLNPDKSRAALYLSEPQAGEYTIIIQQGGETQVEETIDFAGPNLQVGATVAHWSGNELQEVQVQVTNTGDLPAQVKDVAVVARGQSMSARSYTWIDSGASETVSVTPTLGSITITAGGEVRGSVTANTTNGVLTGEFTRTFEGANVEIVSVQPDWTDGILQTASVTIENTGDLAASTSVLLRNGGEALAESRERSLQPGERVTVDLESYGPLYEATSDGTVELTVVADSDSGFTEQPLTQEIEGASFTVESISPEWQNGQLGSVTATIRNDGEVRATPSVVLLVNGEELARGSTEYIAAGDSITVEFGDSLDYNGYLYTATGGEVTVEVALAGEYSGSDSTRASFAGPDASVTNVDTIMYQPYGETTYDFSSLSFTTQNSGDVTLTYDSVRLSVDGVTNTYSLSFDSEVAPGGSSLEYISPDFGLSPGTHTITIELLNDGEVVGTDTATITAG